MGNHNQPFLSVGIDVGADFSLMAIALPTQEIIGRPYKVLHSSLNSIQGAVDRIRDMEVQHGLSARIFMESTGIYHYPLYYRLKDEGLSVFILNPIITHANSNIDVRGVHNDKFDAQKIALLGLKPKLKTSVVPDDDVAAVKALVREYHAMKKECSQYICRLTAQLRQTFPQYLPLFSKVNGKASLEILCRYPTPETILAADTEELTSIIQKTAGKGRAMAEQKCALLKQAASEAASFGHSNAGNIYLILHFVEMIRLIDAQTGKLLSQIRESVEIRHDSPLARHVNLLQSIPGVGFLSAVTLVCEIGDFSVFRRPKQLYAYFGLDPRVRQSGNFKGTELKISKRGSSFARRCIYILALQSVSLRKNGEPKNPVLREYYLEKCKSKAKMTALGAIMHKVCNIIFAVLRDEKPFVMITPDEHRTEYHNAVQSVA
ncbi:IS110 family transposase ISCth8 [Caprobacter fermentans]|uniref:IS110 family transposase ISCth8 n=1 Tax=Caproicibacter fermentans TaxID=2576756 RepID=A0A6N8I376_9FIRM|nr:IS110 family transposase [Caproicibacter fermentans]MVB12399.1 IS110 family transposase ISCth8 [Caproicibacter fermentans]